MNILRFAIQGLCKYFKTFIITLILIINITSAYGAIAPSLQRKLDVVVNKISLLPKAKLEEINTTIIYKIDTTNNSIHKEIYEYLYERILKIIDSNPHSVNSNKNTAFLTCDKYEDFWKVVEDEKDGFLNCEDGSKLVFKELVREDYGRGDTYYYGKLYDQNGNLLMNKMPIFSIGCGEACPIRSLYYNKKDGIIILSVSRGVNGEPLISVYDIKSQAIIYQIGLGSYQEFGFFTSGGVNYNQGYQYDIFIVNNQKGEILQVSAIPIERYTYHNYSYSSIQGQYYKLGKKEKNYTILEYSKPHIPYSKESLSDRIYPSSILGIKSDDTSLANIYRIYDDNQIVLSDGIHNITYQLNDLSKLPMIELKIK